jgi:hypothetical protein
VPSAGNASLVRGSLFTGGGGFGPFQDGFHYVAVYDGDAVMSCGDIPVLAPADGKSPTERSDFILVALKGLGGSGVDSDLVLWERFSGVGLAVGNALTNEIHLGFRIHSGACAGQDPTETLFEGILWANEGGWASTELAALQDGNHYIDIHAGVMVDEFQPLQSVEIPADSVVIACADIPEA